MATAMTDCGARSSACRGRGSPRTSRPMARKSPKGSARSEEHTSELQSLMRISYAVFCLKKKKKNTYQCDPTILTKITPRNPNQEHKLRLLTPLLTTTTNIQQQNNTPTKN